MKAVIALSLVSGAALLVVLVFFFYDHHALSSQIAAQQVQLRTEEGKVSDLEEAEQSASETSAKVSLGEAECAAHYENPNTQYFDAAQMLHLEGNIQTSIADYSKLQSLGMSIPSSSDIAQQDSAAYFSALYSQCLSNISTQ